MEGALDLESHKTELIRRCQNAFNWSSYFAQLIVSEYMTFLAQKAENGDYHGKIMSPSHLVDQVWHTHILDTKSYMWVCHYLDIDYLHHVPQGAEESDSEAQARRYDTTYRVMKVDSRVKRVLDLGLVWPAPKSSHTKRPQKRRKTTATQKEIYIKTITGKTTVFPIDTTTKDFTIDDLMNHLVFESGLPPDGTLVFAGRRMNDMQKKVADVFRHGSTVHYVGNVRGS